MNFLKVFLLVATNAIIFAAQAASPNIADGQSFLYKSNHSSLTGRCKLLVTRVGSLYQFTADVNKKAIFSSEWPNEPGSLHLEAPTDVGLATLDVQLALNAGTLQPTGYQYSRHRLGSTVMDFLPPCQGLVPAGLEIRE